MNADLIDRNRKASDNGKFCEEFARRLLPSLEWIGGVYDAEINGVPLDVKGCEAWYPVKNNPYSDKRAGRVTLDIEQDTELKDKNGIYLCIVHFGEIVVNSFFVPAEKVKFQKQYSWKAFHKFAEGISCPVSI
jgi:hypothetical protein